METKEQTTKMNEAVRKARVLLENETKGAAWLALIDVGEFLNFSGIARKYFGKSGNWLLQRLHGYNVNGKPAELKTEEYDIFVSALNDMADQLKKAAVRIEKTKKK